MTIVHLPRTSLARAVLPVWLVTALWDAACATALGVFAYGAPASAVWRGVAATALGPAARGWGAGAVAAGLAIHAFVAFAWSAVFVVAVRAWPALRNAMRTPVGAIAVASVYGPAIWLVMSLVVITLATGHRPTIGARWWVQVFAHIPFVSLPLVFTARRTLGLDTLRDRAPALGGMSAAREA